MIDPYRAELTARYSVQENLEWAARERLAREIRPAKARSQRSAAVELHFGALLGRLVRAYASVI